MDRISIVKMAILPETIYKFNAMPIKIPMSLFTEIEKSILKFIQKQKTLNSKSNSEQKKPVLEVSIPHFKLYYQAIVTKHT
jgi:hypothetical protein